MKKLIERVVYSGTLTTLMLLATAPAAQARIIRNHNDTLVRDLA